MPDRRQVLRALLLAGAGIALPAGCGVPSSGPPFVDGVGPTYDPIGGQGGTPPDPSAADSPTMLVELFLAAVSGPLETPEQRIAARERARKFLTGDALRNWLPSTDPPTVVRVQKLSNATFGRDVTTVVCQLQPVGVLATDGSVGPPPDGGSGPVQAEFTVVPNPDQSRSGYRIESLPDKLPPGLLLSDAALDEQYYYPQLLYFWDNARQALIPDLRYVPRAGVPVGQQRAYIVRWLIGGASALISSVAVNILEGTDLPLPNILTESDRLVVNLTGAFQGADLPKVMSALRWSLQPLYALSAGPVVLEIASRPLQVDGSSAPYLADNPADSDTRDPEPQPFCVVGGRVAPVETGYAVPPVLADATRPVIQAALSRDRLQCAFVSRDQNPQRQRLWLGQATKSGGVSYTDPGMSGANLSRPAFLPSGKRVLVVVDGVLYALGTGGTVRVAENVSAFAVAPDGYRIAVVSPGGLGVAALRDTGERLTVGNLLRPLDSGLKELSGVAWTRIDRVLVSGRLVDNSGFGLAEISIDGAILTSWTVSPFKHRITSVVAYPRLPSQLPGSGPALVQTDTGEAFRVFATSKPSPLDAQPSAQPSPSMSPSGQPLLTSAPTAPFFVD